MAITTRTLLTSGPTVLIYPTSPQHRTRSILIIIALAFFKHILSKHVESIPRGAQYAYCYDHTFARVECPSSSMAWDITALVVGLAGLFLAQRGFYEVIMGGIEAAAEMRGGKVEVEAEKAEGKL
jgi:hypothetical protein